MTTEMTLRDNIRTKIFNSEANMQRKKVIDFLGAQIEVRQPLVDDVMAAAEEEDGGIITMLVRYAYVPGTNDRVFEVEDGAALRAMPFGKDMALFLEAVKDLSDLDLKKQEKN